MESEIQPTSGGNMPLSKKVRKPKQERVPLTKASGEICKASLKRLNEKFPGIKIDKKQFVNWVIESAFKKLSPANEKELYAKFYDEELFLAQALKEVRKLKKTGQDFDLATILKGPKF